MISSLFAGISGLNANSTAMTVIGDNIANVNTIAYKANEISFSNVLSTSLTGSNSSDIGRGVDIWDTNGIWTQGSMETTGRATDVSINGIGFFVVTDDSGAEFYTRAGQFYLDQYGNMVNPDGLNVMGYEIDPATGSLGSITQVSIPGDRVSPPQQTTEFNFDINLDAGAAVGDTFAASQTIYDSLGNPIELTLTFTNQAAGQWDCVATVPDSEGGPPPNVTIDGGASILVEFDSDGNMIAPAANPQLDITLINGATTPLTVDWTLFDALGQSYGDVTGYANPQTVASLELLLLFTAAVVVGGAGTLSGPMWGTLFVVMLPEVLTPLKEYQPVVFGLALAATVLLAPGGIASLFGYLQKRFRIQVLKTGRLWGAPAREK